MSLFRTKKDPFGVRHPWKRWIDVVQRFSRRGRNRRAIATEEYERRHQDLLRACEAAIASGGQAGGPEKVQVQRMLTLARPWLNTDLLEHAAPTTLQVLLRDCRELEQEMGWRRSGLGGRLSIRFLGVLLVAGVLCGLAWPIRERLMTRAWLVWRPIRVALREVSPGQWVVVGGLAAGLLGFLLILSVRTHR
jgi:hypothetical protein